MNKQLLIAAASLLLGVASLPASAQFDAALGNRLVSASAVAGNDTNSIGAQERRKCGGGSVCRKRLPA